MKQLDLEDEVLKTKGRLDLLSSYIRKAEEIIYGHEITSETPPEEVRNNYEIAKKTQLDLLEFIRKYIAQNPTEDDEVMKIARQLKTMGEEELKQVRKSLLRALPGRSILSTD